jgi:hypothetical protein
MIEIIKIHIRQYRKIILCCSLIWKISTVMVLVVGCTGFNQAYEERVCWKYGLPNECKDHAITLNCPKVPVFTKLSKSPTFTKVFVKPLDGPANPQIGYLFSRSLAGDKPIYLTGEKAWETLQKDLKMILRSYGLKIQEDKQDIDVIVEGNITFLDVRSTHGGGDLLDFKMPTKAQASFEVKIMDSGENMLWHQEFYGSNEIMASYAYLKDSQDILGQAYCQALSEFVTDFESFYIKQ